MKMLGPFSPLELRMRPWNLAVFYALIVLFLLEIIGFCFGQISLRLLPSLCGLILLSAGLLFKRDKPRFTLGLFCASGVFTVIGLVLTFNR
ncbi:MAG: hypothetical protein EOO38_15310 [Cytophagaceae bacterium]|nr:MAG: hypothetical protein EOO38_15310 [Cytophagaceae bacterium]